MNTTGYPAGVKNLVARRDAARAALSDDQKRLVERIDELAYSAWSHLLAAAECQAKIEEAITSLVNSLGKHELVKVISYYQLVLEGCTLGAQFHGSAACGGRNNGLEVPRAILSALNLRQTELANA